MVKMDWFAPVSFEAGMAALTLLMLFGVRWLLK
jgi:hypothetical protein